MKQPYEITKISPFSKKAQTQKIEFDMADYDAWQKGKLIQNAMPYLTPSEREFLMTGITAEEWDNAFKGGS